MVRKKDEKISYFSVEKQQADNFIGNIKGICRAAHAFYFWLNVQQISNPGEIDKQIIVDINLDCGIKGGGNIGH